MPSRSSWTPSRPGWSSPTRPPSRSTGTTGRTTPAPARPRAVVRAETAAHVQDDRALGHQARRAGRPARGRERSLSGGSMAVDGGIVLSLERMRAVEIDTDRPRRRRRAGCVQRRGQAGRRRRARPLVPAGPVVVRDLLDRRQHRDQRRRPVLREVRRDHRLRPRPRRGARRRHPRHARRQADQGRRRACRCSSCSSGPRARSASSPRRSCGWSRPSSRPRRSSPRSPPWPPRPRAVVELGRTVRASMVELMDQASINVVEDFRPMGLDRDAGALLLVQSDAPGASRAEEVAAIVAACEAVGRQGRHRHRRPGGRRDVRRGAARALHGARGPGRRAARGRRRAGAAAAGAARRDRRHRRAHDVEIPVVAHAGDGNTHPTIVYDPTDPDSERRARLAFDDVMHTAIRLGGTITGEHGVGRTKKRGVCRTRSAPTSWTSTRKVKAALDPQGILNPGSFV